DSGPLLFRKPKQPAVRPAIPSTSSSLIMRCITLSPVVWCRTLLRFSCQPRSLMRLWQPPCAVVARSVPCAGCPSPCCCCCAAAAVLLLLCCCCSRLHVVLPVGPDRGGAPGARGSTLAVPRPCEFGQVERGSG